LHLTLYQPFSNSLFTILNFAADRDRFASAALFLPLPYHFKQTNHPVADQVSATG
jgi:hypothetical protein